MASNASSSTKNPPRKLAKTNVIDISSNESSPLQQNNPIPTTLNTNLALSITSPMTSQITPTQPIEVSPLAPRALVFSTPPNLPIEPHPYLNSLDELPPRSSNPPPPPPTQGINQTLPQHTPIDFEPFFPPINLSRRGSRMIAQLEPFMSRDQVMQELGQIHEFSHHLEAAIQNAQSVQDSLFPPFTSIPSQIPPQPPLFHFTTTYTTTIPPFIQILSPFEDYLITYMMREREVILVREWLDEHFRERK
ncbi:hypothetical protein Tco_0361021 [Tanacetum coccineum]